jgi:hypothetical protein
MPSNVLYDPINPLNDFLINNLSYLSDHYFKFSEIIWKFLQVALLMFISCQTVLAQF